MKQEANFICFIELNEKFANPSEWTEETKEIISAHSNLMDMLVEDGKLIFAGRTDSVQDDNDLIGVVLFKADSIEEARAIMSRDPGVLNLVQRSRVFPFILAKNYAKNLT